MDVTPLFNLMNERDASDLYLTVGSPVCIKVKGNLERISERPLGSADIDEIIAGILSEEQIAQFNRTNDFDTSLSLAGAGRFRINVFRQRNAPGLVARRIASEILSLEQLGMPEVMGDLALLKRGLVLVVGGTGSGKSTTLAGMIDHRNTREAGHILTMEDPIEFMHKHKKSIVNQREIGSDSESYHSAIRGALRQAPDVLLLGEIRDRESMEAAISFSETGHLVLSTLHSNNASQTLERIIGFFPQEMHDMILLQLSQNLQGVIAQRLIRTKDGKGRVPAMEIMLLTARVADLIRKAEFPSLRHVIEMSEHEGMCSFDMALYNLYESGAIDGETAIANADAPTDLNLKIRSEEGKETLTDFQLEIQQPEFDAEKDDLEDELDAFSPKLD